MSMQRWMILLIGLCLSAPAMGTVWQVNVSGLNFTPANLTIQQCDTVVWENTSGVHNVVEDDGLFDSGDPASAPWEYTFVFNGVTPGTYHYICEVHVGSGMTGTITVLASNPQLHLVNVSGLSFTPQNLTVTQGDTVRWENTSGTHNVREVPGEVFHSGDPAPAPWAYEFVFNSIEPGSYDYQCDLHVGLGMTGTVTVEADECPALPPEAPLDVVISRSGSDVMLSWTAVPNAADYEIFSSTDGGAAEFTNSIGTTAATTFTHTNILTSTNNLYYQVKARGN